MKEIAKNIFKQYPNFNIIYVCEDGNVFEEKHKISAFKYASDRKIKVEQFDRINMIDSIDIKMVDEDIDIKPINKKRK